MCFPAALCVSGTFDLTRWLDGPASSDFFFSSPIHYLPQLAEGEIKRNTCGRASCCSPMGWAELRIPGSRGGLPRYSVRKGIPNRVDEWGPEWPHDWVTWREMFPRYVDELTR